MADKLKPGISVRTTFVDGESPKAAKLNSLSSQLLNATQRLEAAIGDIHTESYPYSSLTDVQLSLEYGRKNTISGGIPDAPTRALDIATLGRLIGPASNLNPDQLGAQTLVESVSVGVYEWTLGFPPADPSAVIFSDTTVFASYVTSDITSAGQYSIDSYGRVNSYSITTGGTVTYVYDPLAHAGGNTYQDSSFNVLPDPNQLALGVGCAVGALDSNSRRPIVLPTVTHHHYNVTGTTIALGAADPAYGQQLYLPKILVDNFSIEEEIPSGFLYLKNFTKNKVYKSATYYYYSDTSILIGVEDITNDVNDGDVFCIITVGTDITTSIDDLRRKSKHTHNRAFGEPLVSVKTLSDILSAAGNSGIFVPSEIPGNYFPQYLHRDGHRSGTDSGPNDQNIMRGDLAIGDSEGTAGKYFGASSSTGGDSFKLKFYGGGSESDTYARIYKEESGDLVLYGGQNGIGRHNTKSKGVMKLDKGLTGNDDVLTHLLPLKPYGMMYASKSCVSTDHLMLYLDTDYGFDTSITPLGIQIMVMDNAASGKIWSAGGDGVYGFDWVLYDSDSSVNPWWLDIQLTGSSWNLASTSFMVRIILWYLG